MHNSGKKINCSKFYIRILRGNLNGDYTSVDKLQYLRMKNQNNNSA